VSPAVPGLLAALGVALAVRGMVLMRAPGPAEERLRRDATLPAARRRSPLADRIVDRVARAAGPRVSGALDPARRAWIARRLDLAGRPGGMSVDRYVGQIAAYGVLGLGLLVGLSLIGAGLVGLPVAAVALVGPHILLSRQGRLRQERIQRDLPDFLDVLSVTVRAGLTYRAALARVSQSLGGPVAEELRTTLRQIDLGASFREAFVALRNRNDSESLNTFVGEQLQADELGTPLADTLADLAEEIRRTARQEARRRAQQAAPRVSLIVTTVIVPASILLILAALFFSADVGGSGLLD
jgi:tight adherence protein C